MRLCARYQDAAALLRDHSAQITHGGLLIRTEPPSGLLLFDPAEVELIIHNRTVVVKGEVVQLLPGIGVAVAFGREALSELDRFVKAAETLPPALRKRPVLDAFARIAEASTAEKIQLALHGDR